MQYRSMAFNKTEPEEEAPSTPAIQLKAVRPINTRKKGAFREALIQAFQVIDQNSEELGADGSALVTLAGQLILDAVDGDKEAIRQIADRLDGRPAQAVEVTGEDGGPLQFADVTQIEVARRIAHLLDQGVNLLGKQQKVIEHG